MGERGVEVGTLLMGEVEKKGSSVVEDDILVVADTAIGRDGTGIFENVGRLARPGEGVG